MNWTGKWHTEGFGGEGLDIAEYADGYVFAHYFTLTGDGSSEFRVADGKRIGNTAKLIAYTVDGVVGNHKEHPCGFVQISESVSEDTLLVRYEFDDIAHYDRVLEPLYVPNAPPVATTKIRILNNAGQPTGVPCDGSGVKSGEKFSIEVLQGTLTIKDIVAFDNTDYNQRMEGMKKGSVFPARTAPYNFMFRLDPGWEQKSGNYDFASLAIHSKELGPIFNLAAHVDPS